jgi:hypothetical protein
LSKKGTLEIECTECGAEGYLEGWASINASLNPELKDKLLEGKLHVYQCDQCGASVHISAPLLYHDMDKEFMVQFYPFGMTESYRVLNNFDRHAKLNANWDSITESIPEYMSNIHVVFSMNELVRYITFMDRLIQHKKSIENGLTACFTCDRGVPIGELCYCVSRNKAVKTNDDMDKDEIVESMTSIQVCGECFNKPRAKDLDFGELQIYQLKLEIKGFSQFRGWRTKQSNDWQPLKKIVDSCSLCRTSIDSGDTYTKIELSEEQQIGDLVQTEGVYLLSIICEKCAEKYMVWLY